MSEFKTSDSVDRILGDSKEDSDTSALVNLIRKHPFSVILLDEFEKAHSNVLKNVEKAIAQTFRREFVNRIDRVVIFRPLNRAIMRKILYNELGNILQRRGLNTAESLIERITNYSVPTNLIVRFAQQLYLLNEAYESLNSQSPKDAFTKIKSNPSSQKTLTIINKFALELKGMYLNWAKKRRMKYKVLYENREGEFQNYVIILAASGFGAYLMSKHFDFN